MTTFTELGLIAPLLKAIDGAGYTIPSPIQEKAIKPILDGHDLLGIAQTGTGKTAAFALPILQRLAADRRPPPRKGCRVLVLSPTRELATQIAESFRTYGEHLGISVAVVFGGVSHRPQINALARGLDVLVATPGRLLDHMAERNAILTSTEVFVLDEADQMLDLGFFKPIRRIVSQLPKQRQSLFFSATMPKEIEVLTTELLHNPVKVEVAPRATTVELINQRVIHVEHNRKRSLLVELLADKQMSRTLVFTRTKRGADKVAKHLDASGINVSAIHGNKSQRQREEALGGFRDGDIRVLVATDIAARGIDVSMVTHVVNYELPEVPEAYVHRIGRTARAGASGIAISLCGTEERGLLRDIERLTRQTIAAEDRRSDATLEVDTTSKAPDRDRKDRGRGGQRGGGDRSGGGNRSGQGAGRGAGQRAGYSAGNGGRPRTEHGDRGSARGGRDGGGDRRDDRPFETGGWTPSAAPAPRDPRRNGDDRGPARGPRSDGPSRDARGPDRNARPAGDRPREGRDAGARGNGHAAGGHAGAHRAGGAPRRDGDRAPSTNHRDGGRPARPAYLGRPSGDRTGGKVREH